MSTQHPLTPPEELLELWYWTGKSGNWQNALTLAYRAGADQELKACCEHMRDHQWGFVERPDGTKMHRAVYLQQSRRPKPPSLKEQALAVLTQYMTGETILTKDSVDIIRRALEALDD